MRQTAFGPWGRCPGYDEGRLHAADASGDKADDDGRNGLTQKEGAGPQTHAAPAMAEGELGLGPSDQRGHRHACP
ncbi:hypothetical protein E4T56_gene9033, partial [Termitomyces sp. T112]